MIGYEMCCVCETVHGVIVCDGVGAFYWRASLRYRLVCVNDEFVGFK